MNIEQELAHYLMEKLQENKRRSVHTSELRLSGLLANHMAAYPDELQPRDAVAILQSYATDRSNDTVRSGKRAGHAFWQWMLEEGRVEENIFASPLVKKLLKRYPAKKAGAKLQLNVDAARLFMRTAMREAEAKPRGPATPALLALLLGLRIEEALGLQAEHVDADCSIVHVRDAKTESGVRSQAVPVELQDILRSARTGLASVEYLFQQTRYAAYRQVNRLCRKAGVREVGPHGLRRTHASIARGTGMTGPAVAAALGHSNDQVTNRHYIAPGVAKVVDMDAVRRALKTGTGQ